MEFGTKTFFVDDVRYQNEYDVMRELGFTMILCEPNPKESSTITEDESNHESEQDWKLWIPDLKLRWETSPQIRAATLILRESSFDRKNNGHTNN